jgi:hypothetical protein
MTQILHVEVDMKEVILDLKFRPKVLISRQHVSQAGNMKHVPMSKRSDESCKHEERDAFCMKHQCRPQQLKMQDELACTSCTQMSIIPLVMITGIKEA